MKKLSRKKKYFLLKQAARKHRHELKRKEKRKKLKCLKQPILIKNRKTKKFVDNPKKADHLYCQAPLVFSLVQDPAVVISFFKKAHESLMEDVPVYFDLSKIVEMGPETLTYLCALINEDKFTNQTAIQGNSPTDPKLKEMFTKAGFYKFVTTEVAPEDYSKDISDELIHRLTRERVESPLAGEICRSAMKHTFNTEDFTKQNFYKILIECMGNTWNHANFGQSNEFYNWWLFAYKEPITKITKFCFLDLGVGIFGSLKRKFDINKLEDWLKWFRPDNNIETLEKIFQGEQKTSTKGLPGRGLGINNIYKLIKIDNSIRNFTLLSNDIIAKIGYNTVDNIKRLELNFEGTLYYWELMPYAK